MSGAACAADAPCGDYRAGLQADFSDPSRVVLKGSYPASCGEKSWPVAFVIDPKLSRDVKTITLSYTFFEVGGSVPPPPPTAAADLPLAKVGS